MYVWWLPWLLHFFLPSTSQHCHLIWGLTSLQGQHISDGLEPGAGAIPAVKSCSNLLEGPEGFRFSPLPPPDNTSTPGPEQRQEMEQKESTSDLGSKEHITVAYNPNVDVSGVDEAKLIRRVDWQLLPWLSFLYLLSFLDRTSIGNAKVISITFSLWPGSDVVLRQLYNLADDLRLSDRQYLLCLTIFYFSYSFFEVPLSSSCGSPWSFKHLS